MIHNMNKNRLKLSNLITEDYSQNDKNTIEKIISFFKTASSDVLETEQAKKLKEVISKIVPDIDKLITKLSMSPSSSSLDIQSNTITNDDDFYKAILNCIGAPVTKENMKFMYAWRQAEGATAKNNPFNTTRKRSNATNYNSVGVKNYPTKDDGIQATCETLKLPMYTSLISQLKSGTATASEMANNSQVMKIWGTGDLIAKITKAYDQGSSPKPPPIAT